MQELTARQQAFCEHYVVCRNAAESARLAGYSPRGAHVRGSELLANRKVKERVTQLLQNAAEQAEVSLQRIIGLLAEIAFSKDPKELELSTNHVLKSAELLLRAFEAQQLTERVAKIEEVIKHGFEGSKEAPRCH